MRSQSASGRRNRDGIWASSSAVTPSWPADYLSPLNSTGKGQARSIRMGSKGYTARVTEVSL